jgi:DNA mismatch repair protein MutL
MAQPPDIIQLPDLVANQIAAGEVIERPAAVVKELVENSLDAGATRIVVRIADGGRRLIEVEDDGHGLRPEDLRRAFGRHATSKLRNAEDLFRIETLGFRGEALPSIAAVSRCEFASRPHGKGSGFRLALDAGVETAFGPVGMAEGTRLSVHNLFWNVPARLKFLKAEASESGHVTDQVTRLALAHPAVAFRLECQEAVVLDLPPGGTLLDRISAIFGAPFSASLLPLAVSGGGMELTGFIAHPREAKPTSKRQYTFLNGRWVRDRLLVAAVRDGFKGFLEPRLHGAVFLHLDCDPSQVDVNVHPTKSEVRFRNEGEVFALFTTALQAVLKEHQGGFNLLTPTDRASAMAALPARPTPANPLPAPPIIVVQERFIPAPDPSGRPVVRSSGRPEDAGASADATVPQPTPRAAERPVSYATTGRPDDRTTGPGAIKRVLQLHDMFLLIETEQGIRLVDQHALHEKALFLTLDARRASLTADGRQELLVPRPVELTAAEVAAVKPALPALATFGIVAEVFGPSTVLIRAHPARLKRLDWARFFTEVAADATKAVDSVQERILHRLACHGAVKAGQRLSDEECHDLARLLIEMEGTEHCPHGRPTTLTLTWDDLARRFQR